LDLPGGVRPLDLHRLREVLDAGGLVGLADVPQDLQADPVEHDAGLGARPFGQPGAPEHAGQAADGRRGVQQLVAVVLHDKPP
jgi:hypothetical protein